MYYSRCIGIVRVISGCICSHSIHEMLYSVSIIPVGLGNTATILSYIKKQL